MLVAAGKKIWIHIAALSSAPLPQNSAMRATTEQSIKTAAIQVNAFLMVT